MIRISLTIAFIAIFNSGAQIQLENKSLTQPDLQLLYSGRENRIILSAADTTTSYTITSTACAVKKKSETEYHFYPPYNVGIDTIRVIEGQTVLKEMVFRILNMPINTVQIANLTPIQKKASKKEVLANPNITLIHNSLYISEEKIVSYDFRLFSPTAPDSLIFEKTESLGTEFSIDQINAIQKTKAGDRLEISRIIVQDSEGVNYVYRGLYVIFQ